MADESNWQNEVESPQRGGVTGEVIRRRHGKAHAPTPGELRDDEQEREDAPSENERAKAEGYADKWEKRFAHLPGVEPSGGD